VIVTATRGQATLDTGSGGGAHAMPTNLFQLFKACRIRAAFQHVRLATLPASNCLFGHFGEQVHIPDLDGESLKSVHPRGPTEGRPHRGGGKGLGASPALAAGAAVMRNVASCCLGS
jgi:hypothetical protein